LQLTTQETSYGLAGQRGDRAMGTEVEAVGDEAGAAVRGLTVGEVARRYRVGEDKVRAWIRSGELAAINTAAVRTGRPRFVVTADGLAAFERRRAAAGPPAPARQRRAGRPAYKDYYPDA
jgi:excisionase family DNA binding protein